MKSRKNTSFDRSVILTFIVTSLVALTISAYRLSSSTNCHYVNFSTTENQVEVGKVIHFVGQNTNSSVEWSFGDSTGIVEETTPLHIFRFPGKYLVKLKTSQNCEITKIITVVPTRTDSTGFPAFVAPLKAYVGEKVRFYDTTKNASSWEWRFGESFDKISKQRDPQYIYTTPGIKNVILVVNGKNQYYTKKQITILPKAVEIPEDNILPPPIVHPKVKPLATQAPANDLPSPVVAVTPTVPASVPSTPPIPSIKEEHQPKAAVPKVEHPSNSSAAAEIDQENLIKLFGHIDAKKRRVEDLGPYICENYSLPVSMTNLRTSATKSLTLKEFTKNLKGLKITEIIMTKDPSTKCITGMKVEYKFSDW